MENWKTYTIKDIREVGDIFEFKLDGYADFLEGSFNNFYTFLLIFKLVKIDLEDVDADR